MSYKPRKMLVTGGAGFIGCNFVRHIISHDPDIHLINLDNLTYAGSLDNLNDLPDESHHTFIQGDICDRSLVDGILRKYDIDTVAHFAAESHVDRSISGPGEFVRTNIQGTFTLLEAVRQFWQDEKKWDQESCRFHHVSTDEVYGTLTSKDEAFTEISQYAPNSPYSATKAGADHIVRAWHCTYGLPVTTTNSSNNYGPYQHWEKFIPTVIRACLAWKPIPIYGNGTNIRDWLYVQDHCRGIEVVIREGNVGSVYNLGGKCEIANIDMCRIICELMDELRPFHKSYTSLICFVEDRPGHDWRYALNCEKITAELNWKPVVDFKAGLRKTVEWYVDTYASQPAFAKKIRSFPGA
jgi:dTDP-glucose 4,6-dehydratase